MGSIKYNLAAGTINGKHSWLLEYYNEIKSGNIIAGRELIQCLENLLADLDNPDYTYNTKEADFRILYMERFCKQTKSPFFGIPLKLLLCQKAYIEALYSFKWADTGFRKFKKSILMVARKNFKSTFCAALAKTEFMCGPGGMDIVCSSNDDNQANIIFDEINNMREQFDPESKRTHKNQKGMFNLKNKSRIFKLSDRTRNKEGRNIDFAILDESHEMLTNVIAKSIEQSQSTKDSPLFINITTEGFVTDGYLDHELKYARMVLEGEIDDPTLLAWFYSQDSETEIWQDEQSWFKSNPSLGVIKKWSYLRDQIRKSQVDKGDRAFMLAKDFNLRQSQAEAWLLPEEIDNPETFNPEDLRGCIALGGIDLSEVVDLTCAKAMIMKGDSLKKYTLTKYFIPESKIEQGEKDDKKNYLEWARQGLIDVSPGNEIDYSRVRDWYVSLYKKYGIRFFKIVLDRWGANYLARDLEDVGFESERITFDKYNISSPMKAAEADIKSKLLIHENNPVDVWCLGNTSIKVDNLGRVMPVKILGQKNKRIDGTAALLICYYAYQKYRSEYMEIIKR